MGCVRRGISSEQLLDLERELCHESLRGCTAVHTFTDSWAVDPSVKTADPCSLLDSLRLWFCSSSHPIIPSSCSDAAEDGVSGVFIPESGDRGVAGGSHAIFSICVIREDARLAGELRHGEAQRARLQGLCERCYSRARPVRLQNYGAACDLVRHGAEQAHRPLLEQTPWCSSSTIVVVLETVVIQAWRPVVIQSWRSIIIISTSLTRRGKETAPPIRQAREHIGLGNVEHFGWRS
ncbi:hypothetical protein T484DRAFT_2281075 [Baffinella frigidus]|nr:hypothetical protein T484DRAFT_2281075 [Cryptophyta sp. CCMP2293]